MDGADWSYTYTDIRVQEPIYVEWMSQEHLHLIENHQQNAANYSISSLEPLAV